jgi:hypothetical protein
LDSSSKLKPVFAAALFVAQGIRPDRSGSYFVELGLLVGACLPASIAQEKLASGHLRKGTAKSRREKCFLSVRATRRAWKLATSDRSASANSGLSQADPHVANHGGKRTQHEQGLTVHQLANLGGLVALAGLTARRPTSSVGLADQRRPRERDSQRSATRTGRFGRTQTTRTKADSQARLGVVQACQHFPSETLSREQIREIIDALGEHAAENSAQLIASLSALLT